MSRRGDQTRVFNVAVVGLSGIEKDKGQIGVGKSCLCNRFVRSRADDYFPDHISVLSVTDFSGRVVNNDHFLYWGYATKATEDSPEIGFNVVEQDLCNSTADVTSPLDITKIVATPQVCTISEMIRSCNEDLLHTLSEDTSLSLPIEKIREILADAVAKVVLLENNCSVYKYNGKFPEMGLALQDDKIVTRKIEEEDRDNLYCQWSAEFMPNFVTMEPPHLFSSGFYHLIDNYSTKAIVRRRCVDTEFIDDATFQPFKGGKMEPYVKRCAATRLFSAEKLMYICKSQLGIEKEYEQKVLPDGRLNIDGFIVTYDVSAVPGRSIDRQTEFSAAILFNIIRSKKPVVLVTTKNDESCEAYVKEAEKLVNRKEFRQLNIPIVETSAHENVNVDAAFLLLAQIIDKLKNRIRPLSYNETSRNRKEMLDSVSDSFQALIQSLVTNHRADYSTQKDLPKYPAFQRYIELFGEDCAQRLFRRHLKRLKDEFLSRRERRYLERLPEILQSLFPVALPESQSWDSVVQRIKEHPQCSLYFVVAPSGLAPETDWTWGSESSTETNIRENHRIPLDLLSMAEAETVWRNLINGLQADRKRGEFRQQFKFLLDNTPYVTPGKSLNELQVLFMGHECFEALTGQEIQSIYEQHQSGLIEKAKRAFVELMLEHAEVFSQVHSSSPMATITQQQVRDMVEILQEDSRYKALDRLDQERRLMLLQHLGFVHCPLREHCPSFPNCMDSVVERLLDSTAPKVQHFNGTANNLSTDAVLTLYLIGAPEIVESIKFGLEEICDDDEYELDGVVYNVDLKTKENEIPINFPASTSGHLQSRLVLYSTAETLEDTKAHLEKTLLSNLAEENGTFSSAIYNTVIVFYGGQNENAEDKDILSSDGQALADSLGCGFVDVSTADGRTRLLAEALQSLVRSLRDRANPHQSPFAAQVVLSGEPDIRVIMCMFCGDSYNVGSLIAPLFTLPACQQTNDKAISLLTFLGERRRCVQIIMSSFHGASSHREDLVHGLILVYSANRIASFSALKAFSGNVPNLPIQIVAVTENGGAATAMFSSSLGQKLITEGNALADELRGHFATWSGEHTVGIYTPFFRQVWDQKSDIEKAFRMESPPLYRPPPPAPRPSGLAASSEGQLIGSTNDSDDIYEQLPSDDSDDGGSGDALVRPSMIRQRQATQQQQYLKHKMEPSVSDNFVMRERELEKFDNLWTGARRSNREGGTTTTNVKNQQVYLANAFATGRRSHHPRSVNNNGTSTQLRHGHGGIHGNNVPIPGRLNMTEYSAVTDALSRMRLPHTSPPYSNLPNEDYVSDTGHRNRSNRSRRSGNRLPPPPSDSSSSASPVSDPEDFSRTRPKKKSLKNTSIRSRHHHHPPSKPKVGMPYNIPTVPQGFVPYQLASDSNLFTGSKNKSLTMEEGSEASSPVDVEKKPFARLKEEMSNLGSKSKADKARKAKEKPPKKLTKSKSTEQQPQSTPSFGTSLEEATAPNGILERCVKFIEEEGLDMEGLYRVPGNRIQVETLFSRLAEDANTPIRSLDIPVNAVATALKDFLAKRLPPPIPTEMMAEVERVALISDRSLRLLELKQFLLHLPPPNLAVLRIVFSHLVRVSERSRVNAMDSKNLAICWWPTIFLMNFADMLRFESMRPHLEELVQAMIDQYPFLFCGKEDQVMV